jgi:DNA replication factor GINS
MQESRKGDLTSMYDRLHEAWSKERENTEIQKLTKDFYAELADYVKTLREESRMLDEKTVKGKLLERERKNVERMIEELIQFRYRKAVRKAMAGKTVPKEILTKEEAKLHGEILPLAEAYEAFTEDVLRGHLSSMKRKEKSKQMLVRFLQEIPAIVGSDMETYGPFESEDIATLPVENARALMKQGVVAEVKAK